VRGCVLFAGIFGGLGACCEGRGSRRLLSATAFPVVDEASMGSGSSKKKDKEAGSGYSRETPPVATSPAATQPNNAPSLNTYAVDVSGSASPDR
jgi:hypothetical protein